MSADPFPSPDRTEAARADGPSRSEQSSRLSIFGIVWASFLTLIIVPVIVYDVVTVAHWRDGKVGALITLPLLAAAIWGLWASALKRQPATPLKVDPIAPSKPPAPARSSRKIDKKREPLLAAILAELETDDKAAAGGPAGPFARGWAKLLDLWLAAGAVFVLWRWVSPTLQTGQVLGPLAKFLADDQGVLAFWAALFLLMAASFVVDALVQWAFGVTVGLALVGARLQRTDGGRLSLGQAVGRNFDVWLHGFWVCIPRIPIAINIVRLKEGYAAVWDTQWGTRLVDRNGAWWRTLLTLFAYLSLMVCYVLVAP